MKIKEMTEQEIKELATNNDLMKRAFSLYDRKRAFKAYLQYHKHKDKSDKSKSELLTSVIPIISMVIKAKWSNVESFMLDDLVSEAATKLWQKILSDANDFMPDRPSHLLSFCFSLVHNMICDTFRNKRRGDMNYYAELSIGLESDSGARAIDGRQIYKDLAEKLRAAFNRLCYYNNEHDENGRDVEGACFFVFDTEVVGNNKVSIVALAQKFNISDKMEARAIREHVIVMSRKALIDLREKFHGSIYGGDKRQYYIPSSDPVAVQSGDSDGKFGDDRNL